MRTREDLEHEFEAVRWQAADLLRDARRRSGLSISALAERMGVAKSFLSQVEAGTRNVSVAYLAAAFHALGYRLTISLTPPPQEGENGR